MICKKCQKYTLDLNCPKCGSPTSRPDPMRFSPQDRYGIYRRKLKLQAMGDGKIG